MGFDEAFDILVEKCVEADRQLSDALNDIQADKLRRYGCDIWIAEIVHQELKTTTPYQDKDYVPFYEAAWELCRMGVLRPGPHAPKGMGQSGGANFNADGYAITAIGRKWLRDPERRNYGDPGRMAKMLSAFEPRFGVAFEQRATEAVRCHRSGNYLACCVMAGAAAELIMLAVAIEKVGNEEEVLKAYSRSNGRKAVIDQIAHGLSAGPRWQFDAGRQLLHYWRDDAAHGKRTAISDTVAYSSLAQLLRFGHFCADEWAELTS